jgi:hypothetical protein
MPSRFTMLALAGAGLAAASLAALPQLSHPASADAGPGFGGPGRHGPMMMCESTDARTAAILAYAKTKLAVTTEESANWDKFAAAVQASDDPVKQACAALGKPDREHPPTLTQRLASMDSMLSAHAEQMHQVRAAVDAFYPTLTPDQQRIADQLVPGGGPHGWHGHDR